MLRQLGGQAGGIRNGSQSTDQPKSFGTGKKPGSFHRPTTS